MSALMLLALAGMGVVAGLLAGLLGVGGGLVLVPVLVLVLVQCAQNLIQIDYL